jgi:soluble lytic murein transglycosylase-like protein
VKEIVLMIGLTLILPIVLGWGVDREPNKKYLFWFGCLLVLAYIFAPFHDACGAEPAPSAAPQIRIPSAAPTYRLRLEREAGARFGLDAPIARFAAQIHQESGWRPTAASIYAEGLAQFTPATAAWLPDVCPSVGPPDVWDANWSMRALVCYDAYLYDRVTGASECDRWAFALSAYNGGLGWVNRDKARASAKGADPARWFGHTELYSARAEWARVENRGYPLRILLTLEPAYIAAGWPGQAACP